MQFLDIIYTAFSTLGIIILLQGLFIISLKLLYPPPPQIIYRDVQVPVQRQEQAQQVFIEETNESIDDRLAKAHAERESGGYVISKPNATSARLDPVLPEGLKESVLN